MKHKLGTEEEFSKLRGQEPWKIKFLYELPFSSIRSIAGARGYLGCAASASGQQAGIDWWR
ncbi:MAG: hypothetical protein HY664_02935 [Chloroflexi bacterium]|nr:hypothetical protein [Chloroflexota bacterium]